MLSHATLRRLRLPGIFLVLVLVSMQAFGQARPRTRQTLSISPRIGFNVSNLRGDIDNNRSAAGLAVGGMLTYSVVSHFGVSLEALYSQRGARYEANNTVFTSRINYVEIPVYGRYFLRTEGDLRPNIFLGPSFGFKLNARTYNSDRTVDINATEAYNAVDAGLTAGIGINYLLRPGRRLLFDARYTFGLTDIAANTDRQVYNSVFTITAGLSFGVGKRYER
jgi:hypothetical protein